LTKRNWKYFVSIIIFNVDSIDKSKARLGSLENDLRDSLLNMQKIQDKKAYGDRILEHCVR